VKVKPGKPVRKNCDAPGGNNDTVPISVLFVGGVPSCYLLVCFTYCFATLMQEEHTEVLMASVAIGTVSLSAEK